jgi:predicted TIM-barrel fold metal-dependent hydrolase
MAKEYAPSVGNNTLLKEIEGKPIQPCWVVMPHNTGEMPPPDELLAQMSRRGVKAVRAFPVVQSFKLSDWCVGPLLDMLEAKKIPFFLDMDQTNWDEVAGMLKAHPHLKLVLLKTSYRCDRMLYPLFEKFDNLYLETATFQIMRGIEDVCRKFGPQHLVFGTGLPLLDAGGPIAQITYAELPLEHKRMIAGETLAGLLGLDNWGGVA